MKSSFGKKLFRFFLLFALLPSIILALAGYYIASQESPGARGPEPRGIPQLAEYYNNYLFGKIETSMRTWSVYRDSDPGTIDFLISFRGDTHTIIGTSLDLPAGAVTLIAQAIQSKPRGFIRLDTTYYQYATFPDSNKATLVGGLVHGPAYVELTEYIQTDIGAASSRKELISNYLLFLAVLFIALAGLTAILAYHFSARISKNLASPLTSLSEASKRIADGDFEQRVDVSGFGEIKTLIENFNRMAQQLRVTTSRLAQTERVAAWRNVARRFAHELKNPLQPILVSVFRLENALKNTDQYEVVRQPLQAATEELKHLTELAERFSQLAKLPEPKIESVNLNEFLSSIAGLYSDRLAPYKFALKVPGETVTADIDITYFREAIHNLLQNAIEACDEGGRIELTLRRENAAAVIEIKDNGRGMSHDVVASARIPYFTTKTGGSGIGLAVVDKVVSEINGSILIDSAVGQGTSITISIPARSPGE
ncbi:MAG: HAMP domain-containing protein [Candidatus Zixiibacteriota bacterium]|nr:MAG: HAMP domain-containing protein [candidate division Zixibacteria bacterium]